MCPRIMREREMARDVFVLLRMTHNLKLMNCLFLEFSSFHTSTDGATETIESETTDKEGLLYSAIHLILGFPLVI